VRQLVAASARHPVEWRCEHTPPDELRRGEPLALEVAVRRADGAQTTVAVRLHYRHVNHAEIYRVAGMQLRDGRYQAIIPGEYTDSPYPLQYFLELRDARGRAWLHPGFAADLSNQPYYVLHAATLA
jgi:hypothetical protein